jgi:hypothetical protein
MPIRFTSPSLGGQRQVFLQGGEWEAGVAYRRLTAGDWFVGDKIDPSAGPFGEPVHFNINTFDLSLAYGISRRLSLRLTVPVGTGTSSRLYQDMLHHETSATGVGDVNLLGSYWVLDPLSRPGGNVALGIGVKAPTGRHDAEDEFWTPDTTFSHPVHPTLQPGDGGWGFLLQAQAYRRLAGRLSGYLFGSYLLSPREKTEVLFVPSLPGSSVSVPDAYHAKLGFAYAAWPGAGLSVSLGGRIDGIPAHDIIGGDLGFRNPGYTLFLEPGFSLERGRGSFTASVPLRLRGKFVRNANSEAGIPGSGPDGASGDLASYLVYLGYSHRF